MMEVHKPKPVHGWREFLTEIGIIVIGVLIALAAEQVVARLRLMQQSAENERAFRADIRQGTINAAERIALLPCATERLAHLTGKLTQRGPWSADPQTFYSPPEVKTFDMRETFHSPSRMWPNSSWQNAVQSEALHVLPEERRTSYDIAFDQLADLAGYQSAEEVAEAQLVPLSYDLEMTPELRAHFLAELGEVQRLEQIIQVVSQQTIEDARDLHALPDQKQVDDVIAGQRKFRGRCVQPVKLPPSKSVR